MSKCSQPKAESSDVSYDVSSVPLKTDPLRTISKTDPHQCSLITNLANCLPKSELRTLDSPLISFYSYGTRPMYNPLVNVLLVDDDEDDYILTRDLLLENQKARFSLTWVATYGKGLEMIGQNHHDVYLLDYRLGEHNGLELLREAIARGCTAPIILLTAQGDHEVDMEAMKAGAADYLDKSQLRAPLLERSIRYALERQQAQQKIREQAALLDVATDAILVRDLDNTISFWNKGAESLYGWHAAEVIGKKEHLLLYEQAPAELAEADQSVAKTGEWYGELNQVTKDGKEIIVESRWTLVENSQGQPKSILIVNTNITEKKQLETQFLHAQRMESIGTLAGGIAHDLNNLLAPILMSAQLLQLKISDQRHLQLLKTVENNTRRGAGLVKQVLSFARGVTGKRTVLQVRHLIREIRHIILETFPRSIELSTDIDPNLWSVSGDATQLHQVLMNLCINARDAMVDGGTLTLSAQNIFLDQNYVRMHIDADVGPYIVVTVADTGIGIPLKIQPRIFEPFFTTKEIGQGTGLGLSTVRGIVKSHAGFVNVYSEVGVGTNFKVYLPAVEHSPIPAEEELELPRGNGELILVVDDEAAIGEITKTSLENYGYRVMSSRDGKEAIALYRQHQDDISLVLMDMMMPVMDGPTTTLQLRDINSQIKIIGISGLPISDKVDAAAEAGVKTFLSKPYTVKELLQAIDGVLKGH
ncbi:response regulator [Moorena sp. SIO3I6]|uniref:hybrid sensor histidine kinase/response regulator n=1 Tax=Moorena sp. SIO3I6 TaxID=2607831 RepID=UPI0026006B8A|nr:response regulator [Moorena sp. SIO3I6]